MKIKITITNGSGAVAYDTIKEGNDINKMLIDLLKSGEIIIYEDDTITMEEV